MEKAKDYEDLIGKIAEELQSFDKVYYDVDTLEYAGMFDNWIYEYDEYLDMTDEEIAEISGKELVDWRRDMVDDIKKTLELKSSIDKPASFESFHWMEDFVDDHADNKKFFKDAVEALRRKHPFGNFRDALDWNGLAAEWYSCRDAKMVEYVRNNI